MVLAVDAERERISLGIKQLGKDPFANFSAGNTKGSVVTGVIKEVDAKAAIVDLGDGIEGILRASELSRDRVEDARTVLTVGQEIEASILVWIERLAPYRCPSKRRDSDEEAAVVKDYTSGAAPVGATLGDVLKEQIENSGE